jgi:hypothetical protein
VAACGKEKFSHTPIILYIVETQNGGERRVQNTGTQETIREIAWWEIII